MSTLMRLIAVVAVVGTGLAAPAAGGTPPEAPCYTVEALLPLDGDASAAYGLNDLGLAVGSADTADGSTHAARWQGDGTEDLGTMGGIDAIAFDVNAAGQVTGLITFDVGVPVNRGFRRTGGTVEILEPLPLDSSAVGRAIAADGRVVGTSIEFDLLRAVVWGGTAAFDLGTIQGPQADAWGMNDDGDIVGWSNNIATGYFGRRAFLSTGGGAMQDLGTLGGVWGWAFDVNGHRQVVGEAGLATGEIHAFLWQSQVMLDLGTLTPTAEWSRAQAVNESGDVVGWSRLAPLDATRHAFLWRGGVMHDLNDRIPPGSGWVLTDAWDINATGQIAGVGELNGQTRGFLLTPVVDLPDPTGDCGVDVADLLLVLGAWGVCPPVGTCPGDVDGDGVVAVGDLLLVLAGWSG